MKYYAGREERTMKKKLFIMALFLIVMTIVATGCGKGDQASSDKADSLSDSVKVAAYKGTSSQVVKNLGKDYTVKENHLYRRRAFAPD